MYTPGIYLPMYPGGYGGVYFSMYPGGYAGYTPSWVLCLPTHPGYTTMVYTTLPGMSVYSVSWLSPADGALGSNLGLIREMRRREAFLLLKV